MRRSSEQRPVGVRLADVLTPTLPPPVDVYATSCSIDADRVRPGDVYFAPDTGALDAMVAVDRAIEAGAKAIVAAELLPVPSGVPQLVVENPRGAFGQFCHALLRRPCESINTVAVAGRRGNRSVVRLIQSVCRAAGRSAAATHSNVYWDGAESRTLDANVSTAATVAGWLARSAVNGCTDAVLEASRQALADDRLAGARFQVVCLNEAFDTPQAMTDSLRRLSDEAVLVANVDDQACCRVLSQWLGPVLTYGFSNAADVRGRVIERHTGGQVLLVRCGAETVALETSVVGEAHARSCLAAVAVALTKGIPLADAAGGVEAAQPAPLMMQAMVCGQEFPVYLDDAQQPADITLAAKSAAAVASRRVLTVIAGANKPQSLSPLLDAARVASDLVLAGSDAQPAGDDVRFVEDDFSALALALALAEPGDAVLVVGCQAAGRSPGDEELAVRQLLQLRLQNEQPIKAVG